jgi:hypothetical protein
MEARQWEIAENLHRGELTGEEREAHIVEWVRITDAQEKAKVLAQPTPQQPKDVGIRKAAQVLNMSPT